MGSLTKVWAGLEKTNMEDERLGAGKSSQRKPGGEDSVPLAPDPRRAQVSQEAPCQELRP